MSNMKVYAVLTEKIASDIQSAINNKASFSWVKPWKGYPTGNFISYTKNPEAFKAYRGINRLILDGGLYITMNQLNELEKKDDKVYKVKKGSHRETVYFYKPRRVERKDADGNVMVDDEGNPIMTQYMICRFYNVFNIADIEGLDDFVVEGIDTEYDETKLSKKADKIIKEYCKRSGVVFKAKKGVDSAYHNPNTHEVIVPAKSQFNSLEEYYSTVFHELTHSTKSHCGREQAKKKGDSKYSFEELVAELGACFLMQEIGFDTTKTATNSTAYLKGWLSALKNDVSLIMKASNQAQKAFDYILNIEFEANNEETEDNKEVVA